MADFCKKCADNLGFPEADLTIEKLKVSEGTYMLALCEGCGGYIFIANVQGEERVFRPDKPTIWGHK